MPELRRSGIDLLQLDARQHAQNLAEYKLAEGIRVNVEEFAEVQIQLPKINRTYVATNAFLACEGDIGSVLVSCCVFDSLRIVG